MPKREYDYSETVKIGSYRYYLYRQRFSDVWFGKIVQTYPDENGRWHAIEVIPEPPLHISFPTRLALFMRLLELFDPWS